MARGELMLLPAELLCHILTHLSDAKWSLGNVCVACKRLRNYAEPILYERIFIIIPSDADDLASDEDIPKSRPELLALGPYVGAVGTLLFADTITKRPDLAAHVKSVYFSVSGGCGFGRMEHFEELANLNRILQKWVDVGPRIKTWIDEHMYADASLDMLLDTFVFLLPKLSRLKLDYSIITSGAELISLRSHPKSGWVRPRLKSFKVVNDLDRECIFVNEDSRDWYQAGNMFSLLHHLSESLQEIHIVLNVDEKVFFAHQDSAITCLLELKRASVINFDSAGHGTLAVLITMAPNLTTLEVFFAQNMEPLKWDENFTCKFRDEWKKFTHSLEPVKHCLKNLTLSVDWAHVEDYPPDTLDVDWVNGVWQRRGSLGSLRQLECLERLEVPTCVLLGWELDRVPYLPAVLPPKLRELCLRDDLIDHNDYPWTPWDQDVIGRKRASSFQQTCDASPLLVKLKQLAKARENGDLPSLERICLKVQRDSVWPLRYLMELRSLCEPARLECTMRMRMSGFLTPHNLWNEEVREITIHDPREPQVHAEKSSPQGPEDSTDMECRNPPLDANSTAQVVAAMSPAEWETSKEEPTEEELVPLPKSPRLSIDPRWWDLTEKAPQHDKMYLNKFRCRYFSEPRRQFQSNS